MTFRGVRLSQFNSESVAYCMKDSFLFLLSYLEWKQHFQLSYQLALQDSVLTPHLRMYY